jgi:hypothetical protein
VPNDREDCHRAFEALNGRPRTEEKSTIGADGATDLEVAGNSLANLDRQRQHMSVAAFAAHTQRSALPIDVIQFKGDDGTGAQPQAGEQQ